MGPHRSSGAVVLVTFVVCAAFAARAQTSGGLDPISSGRGWRVVRIDVDVRLIPERGEFTTEGTATLELTTLDGSYGPTLLLSTQRTPENKPAIAFRRVTSAGAKVDVPDEPFRGRWQRAIVRFDEPRPRGSTIDVHFECQSQGTVRRMIVHQSAAVADWLNAWLPFTLPDSEEWPDFDPNLLRAPGQTTLHLPVGWKGLVDGELVERKEVPEGTVEVWHTPEGIARGFVAGPYRIVTRTVNGREIRVYLLDAIGDTQAARIAERLGQAIAAQESKLGPLPVPGAYTVVDFPRLPEQTFGAVSEQTHIIVQPPNLEYADGNLQLFAHEVSHAWWGNLIGTRGPGVKWCSESLAELGALIAIEQLEGQAALHEFLDFGRVGTDPYYSAAGYFAIVRQGNDLPIATMGSGEGTHALSNSKGVWIFQTLRSMLGDETFYGVLREVVQDFGGRDLSADDLRERFVRAAPERNLEGFFAQWLDRTGAPVFDVDWHANVGGTGILVQLTQVQHGEPFVLDLEVAIDLLDGSSVRKHLPIAGARFVEEIPTPARPIGLRLDPDRKLLLWRPEYGPPPSGGIVAEAAILSAELIRAVVGSYRFTGMEKDVEVFERDGSLYVQPEGSMPVRLLHVREGVFRVDAPGEMLAEFDLSSTPSPSFVSIEGGGRERYVAQRVPPSDENAGR